VGRTVSGTNTTYDADMSISAYDDVLGIGNYTAKCGRHVTHWRDCDS